MHGNRLEKYQLVHTRNEIGIFLQCILFEELISEEADLIFTLVAKHFRYRAGAPPLFSDEELGRLTMPVLYLAGEKDGDPHEALYWRFRGQSAIREGKWKFYDLQNGVEMLFDMESDEHENQNLMEQHPGIAKRLKTKLADFRAEQMRQGFAMDSTGEEDAFYKHYFNVKGQ